MGRILAIDYGEKRVGLALSDPDRMIAVPFELLVRTNLATDIARIVTIIDEQRVDALVAGKPLHSHGAPSEMVQRVETFVTLIVAQRRLPVHWIDEGYTSIEADEILRLHSRDWRKRKAKVDMVAAQIILRVYLESLPKHGRPEDRDPYRHSDDP